MGYQFFQESYEIQDIRTHGSKDLGGYKKCDRLTEKQKVINPPQIFKVGGIKKKFVRGFC